MAELRAKIEKLEREHEAKQAMSRLKIINPLQIKQSSEDPQIKRVVKRIVPAT